MDDFESDPEAMKEFEKQYNDIIERLRGIPEGELSLRTKGVIILKCSTSFRAEKRAAQV